MWEHSTFDSGGLLICHGIMLIGYIPPCVFEGATVNVCCYRDKNLEAYRRLFQGCAVHLNFFP